MTLLAFVTLFGSILETLIPLFSLILLGFLLRRYAKVLHVGHLPSFTSLVVNVTYPALVFLAIIRASSLSAVLPLAMIVTEALTLALAYAVGRALRFTRPMLGMLLMVAGFGNTAFLGYPVAKSLVPHAFAGAVMIDQFGMTLPMLLTAGILGSIFGQNTGEHAADNTIGAMLRRWIRSPIFLAATVAIPVRLIPWPTALVTAPGAFVVGTMVAQALGYLAQATTPIALLALGAALQPRAATAASRIILVPCLLKLIVCPLLMWAICLVLGVRGDFLRVGLLQASMPTAVTVSLLCVQYEMEGALASGAIFVATTLSLITVPTLQALLR